MSISYLKVLIKREEHEDECDDTDDDVDGGSDVFVDDGDVRVGYVEEMSQI